VCIIEKGVLARMHIVQPSYRVSLLWSRVVCGASSFLWCWFVVVTVATNLLTLSFSSHCVAKSTSVEAECCNGHGALPHVQERRARGTDSLVRESRRGLPHLFAS